MSDRIDHAAKARTLIQWVREWQEDEGDTSETHLADALMAQAHATLALVEQQQLANLIELVKVAGREEDVHEEVAEVAYEALNALVTTKIVPNGHMDPFEVTVLRPDVAAALGIKTAGGES